MILELEHLNGRSFRELIDIFSLMDKNETEIEFVGEFKPFGSLRLVAQALPFISKRVTTVRFSGTYVVSPSSYREFIGTRWVGGGGGEMNHYRTILCDNYGLGGLLEIYIALLPRTVNSLFFDFKRNSPKTSNYAVSSSDAASHGEPKARASSPW